MRRRRLPPPAAGQSSLETDVGDDAQVQEVAEQAASDGGHIDIWFNNAGIEGHLGPFTEADDAAVQQLVNTSGSGLRRAIRPEQATHDARRDRRRGLSLCSGSGHHSGDVLVVDAGPSVASF